MCVCVCVADDSYTVHVTPFSIVEERGGNMKRPRNGVCRWSILLSLLISFTVSGVCMALMSLVGDGQ